MASQRTTTCEAIVPNPNPMSALQRNKPFPINDLPYDLLGEIFQFCLPHQPSLDVFDHLRSKDHDPAASSPVQMTIASVCKEWRQASFACRSLWGVLSVNVKANGTPEIAKHVRLWLERSGNSPLFIRVGYIQYFEYDNGQLAAVLTALREVSARWKVLEVHVPIKHLSYLHTEPHRQSAPMLECLVIFPYNEPRFRPSLIHLTPIYIGPGSTPRLKRFASTDLRLKHLSFDYAQLTEISATRGMWVADCLEVLHLAPNLISANFRLEKTSNEVTSNCRCVTHTKIQTLYLRHPLSTFWEFATISSLETLCLDIASSYQPEFQFQSLLDFARRATHCSIRRLRITNTHSYDELTFLEFLAEVSSVEHLVLRYECDQDSAMAVVDNIHRRRLETTDGRPFLPCLRNFNVHYGGLEPGRYGWTSN